MHTDPEIVSGDGEKDTEKRPFRRTRSKDLRDDLAGGGEENTEKRPFRRRNSKEVVRTNFSAELTVVVIGSTDTVTYGPGNILLGGEKMLQETRQLSQAAAVRKREVAGRCVSVVDMVGVLDSELPQEEAERWVQQCMYGCEQGIHAFLLAVPLGGLTDQERRGAEWIQRAFGERALGFTVVLLIYGDEEKKELELMKNRDVQQLVEECGGRYQTCCRSISSRAEVSELLEKIDTMLFGNTDRCYTKGMYQEVYLEAWLQEIRGIVSQHQGELRQVSSEETDRKDLRIRAMKEGCGGAGGSRDGLRMVLIGRTGVGKSATGNSILGREAFVSEARDTAVTKVCWRASGEVAGKPITVLDTPGLFGTTLSNEEVRKEIRKSMGMLAPGPHAILLVLQLGKFTKNDENTLKMIREIFGAGSEKYTFILFSHRDCLRIEAVEDYIQGGDTGLKLLLKQCGGRYHSFSNTEMGSLSQVTEFVEKIEKMVESNGGEHFSSELFQDTALRAELRLEEREMETQRLREEVERQREVMEKRENELQKGNEHLLKMKEEVKQKEDRIRESEEKATRWKEEIQKLLYEITNMRDKQKELQEVLARLEEEKQEREEEVQREREQLQREREEVKREREELKKRAEMLERKTAEIKQIEEITEVQKEELEKQRETLERERNDLHQREEKIQRKEEDIEKKMKEIIKKRDEIKTKEEEITKIMDEIQRKDEMIKTGRDEIQTLMDDIRNGKAVIDNETGEVRKVEEGLKAKEVEFERDRAEFQKREVEIKTYKEVMVRELLTKIKERKSNVGIAESQEKETEMMLTYRGDEKEMKKRQLQMEKENKELQWQMENISRREAEIKREIKEEMQRSTEEIMEKEREMQRYKEEVQRLGEEFEEKERKKQREIEKKEAEIQGYREGIQRLGADNKRGEEEKEREMEKRMMEEEEQKPKEIFEIEREKQKEIEKKEAEIQGYKEKVQSLREEFTEKERELERYKQEVQELEYDINNKEGELKTSKEEVQKMRAEIKLKEEDLKKKEGEMQGCEEEMQRLKTELIKKEKENEKDMEKKEREIQMYKEEMQRLGAEIKRREEEKETEMEKRRMMEEEAQKLKEENTEKEKLIQQLQEQIHSMSAVGGVTPASRLSELRVVVVGKAGVGKSAAGNTILGREEFESKPGPSSTTRRCQRAKGEVDGRRVSVVDTPGLLSADISKKKVIGEIKRIIPLSAPGPHVFLFVFQRGAVTEEERAMVEMIQSTFVENALKYSMVLFTHGDDLAHISIEEYLQHIPELQELISRCHGGYHVFNCENMADRAQVTELLEKIDRMVERNGGGHYTSEIFQERSIENCRLM